MLEAVEAIVVPFLERAYATVGYVGLMAVMAVENALFFLPVPSEIVLPLAGWSVARGVEEPLTGGPWTYWLAVAFSVAGSTAGALALYAASAVAGRPALERYGRFVLIDAHDLDVADRWFARYGDYAVLIARMVPVARSVISIPAGISRMPLRRFVLFTVIGTIPWNMLLIWGGVVLGENWVQVKELLGPLDYVVYAAIAVLTLLFLWRQLRPGRSR
ncbi:MAG: DedA family protein [Candidatus Limnocylindria bacterium]